MLMENDREVLKHIEKYKAITLKQANKLFFHNYKSTSRRLIQLEKMKVIKSYENKLTNEKVFFVEDKLSAHDLMVMDFYTELISNGAKIREFSKPRLLKDMVRPDGFFEFEYEDNLYFCLLEVDLNHFTNSSKFMLYEKIYKEGELQNKCYGAFPSLVVMKAHDDIKFKSNNFEVIYLDFKLSNFSSKIF